jgi:hypothetical protein
MIEAGLARKLLTASSLVPPTVRSKLLLNRKYWTARRRLSIIAGAGRPGYPQQQQQQSRQGRFGFCSR